MRKFFRIGVIILALALAFGLVACQNNSDVKQEEPAPYAVSIAVDGSSIPQFVYVNEFDATVLRLNVTYSDGKTETVGVTASMINPNDRSTKFAKPGTWQINLNYLNCATRFQIRVREKGKTYYTLTVIGGIPTAINGEDIRDELAVDGDTFTAEYEENTIVTIIWTEIEGYQFTRWTDNGTAIITESMTRVVMDGDHTYRAESAAIVNSVSFVTNSNRSIRDMRTNVLYESDIPELERDGYVFDGWTTERVSGDAAIDCGAKKITFPYTVLVNTTLYGTWRVLGLEYSSARTPAGEPAKIVSKYSRNDKNLVIPATSEGLPVIGITADAFSEATALETLTIPASVQTIEDGFVRNCALLNTITVDVNSRYFSSNDGVLYNDNGDELLAYPAAKLNATFMPEVRIIKSYAFRNAVVGGLDLPGILREVGDHAFDSVHIQYVNFSSVTPSGCTLGNNLFNENLGKIFIETPSNMAAFMNFPSMRDNADKFTSDPDDLAEIRINNDRTLIYKEIFNENSENPTTTVEIIGADRRLTELVLPVSTHYDVSSIGVKAFNGCIYLDSFIIPSASKLERILEGAFDGTPYAAKLTDGNIIANNTLFKYLGNAETYKLGRTVSRIAESAFRDNKNLKYLDLSDNNSLSYIGAYAFSGCENFEGDASDNSGFNAKRQLKTVGAYAFANTALRAFSVTDDSELTTIKEAAFKNCNYLTQVKIGAKTTEISPDAFLFDASLESFEVVSGNTAFNAYGGVLYALNGENMSLFNYPAGRLAAEFNVANPDGNQVLPVTQIGDYALVYANIASLCIPSSVRIISSSALSLPGSTGVIFESLDGSMTYNDLFVKDDANIGKYAPDYIVLLGADTHLISFFGGDVALQNEIYRADGSAEYVVYGGLVIKIDNNSASVVRSGRTVSELSIPNTVEGKDGRSFNVNTISEYAFMGAYLEKLTLGANVGEIEDNALRTAFNLSRLYTQESGAVPAVYENSFSDKFDNGLFIYVPSNLLEYYKTSWGLSDRYVIDLEKGLPEAVFTYPEGEEGKEELTSIFGEIAPEDAPIPTRTGYTFDGWYELGGDKVDLSSTFKIPYNMTLVCRWKPMEYTVVFVLDANATMSETTVKVQYGSGYDFETPVYYDKSRVLKHWRTQSGDEINPSGRWEYMGAERVVLYPVWEMVKFYANYVVTEDTELNGDAVKEVRYGEDYELAVPTRDGYVFVGWSLKENDFDSELVITDNLGKSLQPWSFNEEESVSVYPIWSVKEGIVVNLYFEAGKLYRTTTVAYGADFDFPYNPALISDDEWAAKADVFCGWFDGYDTATASGIGVRFTDENGKGVMKWNRGGETDLYAQWPQEISDGADLENLTDLSRSVVLTADVNVSKPIGSFDIPYTGTFNGNGFTVNFVLNDAANLPSDGYVGLFAHNKGTIKNLKLNAVIEIENYTAPNLYIGAVAAYNEGKIISTEGADSGVYANISVNALQSTSAAHIGGIIGYNDKGELSGVGMTLDALNVKIAGVNYSKALHGDKYFCGTVVGTTDGGTFANGGKSFKYFYTEDGDPFKNAACGNSVDGTSVDISVISGKAGA